VIAVAIAFDGQALPAAFHHEVDPVRADRALRNNPIPRGDQTLQDPPFERGLGVTPHAVKLA
jgi:hypothetical protein